MTMEILLSVNSLLLLYFLWSLREYWKGHKKQHEQMTADNKALADSINKLTEVYASKSAMFRAHKRIDALENVRIVHDKRLVRIETQLGLPELRQGQVTCAASEDEA